MAADSVAEPMAMLWKRLLSGIEGLIWRVLGTLDL
jgi:hypothetical protein